MLFHIYQFYNLFFMVVNLIFQACTSQIHPEQIRTLNTFEPFYFSTSVLFSIFWTHFVHVCRHSTHKYPNAYYSFFWISIKISWNLNKFGLNQSLFQKVTECNRQLPFGGSHPCIQKKTREKIEIYKIW